MGRTPTERIFNVCFISILIFILLRNSIGIAIVINGIAWFGCKYATTKDPQFFDILWNHIKNDKGMYKAE